MEKPIKPKLREILGLGYKETGKNIKFYPEYIKAMNFLSMQWKGTLQVLYIIMKKIK